MQHVSMQTMRAEHGSVPEEVQKPECLYYNSDERPLEEHKQDAADEAHGAAQLLLAGEEVEGLLRADDECQTGEEEDLWNGEKRYTVSP